jgi:hypothetical protein
MSTLTFERCPCCQKFDHNAFRPVTTCNFGPPPRAGDTLRVLASLSPPDTRAIRQDIDSAPTITIDHFRALARRRGWSEDWLVEQCRGEMDNPRQIIKEILDGRGLTKPWFTSESTKSKSVNMADTILVWTPLIDLFLAYDGLCIECDGELKNPEASYCSPGVENERPGGVQNASQSPRFWQPYPRKHWAKCHS